MKKLALILFLLSLSTASAQYSSHSIKLGSFGPSATDPGFVIGYMGGKYIDEHLDIGWSVDWFHKTYTDKSLADQFNNVYGIPYAEQNELRARTNLHDIPLLFNVVGRLPIEHPKLNVYCTGGIGAEVLLIFYRNFQNPNEDDLQIAFDFSWRIGAGVAYELGRRSEILAELGYHSSAPSWTYEVDTTTPKRTFERKFDMSGLLFRVGIKFYY